MKNLLLTLTAAAALLAAGKLQAQPNLLQPETASTNVNVAPEENFFQQAYGFFTAANTNYCWTNNVLEVSAGADYIENVNWAADLNIQYDLTASGQTVLNHIGFDVDMRNAGIAGTILSLEGGVHYALIRYYSVKLDVGLDGGYRFDVDSATVEPNIGIRSKLGANAFAGIRLSIPIVARGETGSKQDVDLRIETGFTY